MTSDFNLCLVLLVILLFILFSGLLVYVVEGVKAKAFIVRQWRNRELESEMRMESFRRLEEILLKHEMMVSKQPDIFTVNRLDVHEEKLPPYDSSAYDRNDYDIKAEEIRFNARRKIK